MVCVKMALPPFPVTVMLDIQAPSVVSLSKSATATLVRTEDAASTWLMATSVTAYQELQVCTNACTADKLILIYSSKKRCHLTCGID